MRDLHRYPLGAKRKNFRFPDEGRGPDSSSAGGGFHLGPGLRRENGRDIHSPSQFLDYLIIQRAEIAHSAYADRQIPCVSTTISSTS
jgi:hypothetical protein